MKKVFILFLATLMVVSMVACGSAPAETTAPAVVTPTTTVPATTAAPTVDPDPTEDPEAMYDEIVPETTVSVEIDYPFTNPITGRGQAEQQVNRPFAVVINNIKAALPQHGVSQADIVYEILAEGGITRCLAIFSDISRVQKLGSIRSARTYFIDLAEAYDAILVHAGGSSYAYKEFESSGWPHLDGIRGSSKYFYRDKARLDKGVAKEHTLFSSGEKILAAANATKYKLTRDSIDYGFTFSDNIDLNGEVANTITAPFTKKRQTIMSYNAETGLYEGYQQGGDYVDGNTGEVMTFKNVIIIHARTSSDGYRMFADLVGTGNGYFACNGEVVAIKWVRKSARAPFSYTLADGTPIDLGVGTTYVAVLPTSSTATFE